VNCPTAARRSLRAVGIGKHPRPRLGQFYCRTAQVAFEFFSPAQFQMALRAQAKAIILARKAGADPVGASYPKVSCPP
jgi:hypothetical protein